MNAILSDVVSVHISSVNVILLVVVLPSETLRLCVLLRNYNVLLVVLLIFSFFENAVYTHARYTDLILMKTVQEHVFVSCI